MYEFVLKGSPSEVMEQLEVMVSEDERLLLERNMADGDDAEKSDQEAADAIIKEWNNLDE